MGFGLIQAGFLFALAALSIPIIIHLIFRQQPKRVEIGSVRFLQQVLGRHRGRRKAMRWLLLALRMACLTLLAILFARPFFSELEQHHERPFTAILIDHSASMQLQDDGQSLLNEAIERTRELVRDDILETNFEVALFSHKVSPLGAAADASGPPATEANARQLNRLLAELRSIPPSYGATDYAEALRWARDVCTKAGAPSKTVHIFTDMQQSGLDWSEVDPMPADVEVHLHDLGRPLPNNVAVTAATPARVLARPGESVNISVTLLNAGPFTLEDVPVVLRLQNDRRTVTLSERTKLGPNAIELLEFEVPDLESGLWRGEVTIETIDALSFDNQRYLAVMIAAPHDVLLVDGGSQAEFLRETYFLEPALRLAPRGETYQDSPYNPVVVQRPNGLPNLTGRGPVVLANVGDLNRLEVSRLARFVEQGGGLIVFSGERMTADSILALSEAGLTPGEFLGSRSSSDLPWRIEGWQRKHSILEPFSDPQHGDLSRLGFWGYNDFQPSSGAETLAWFANGSPLLVQKTVGSGEVLWFTSTCDQDWADWPRSALFLPLVHQMLGHLTGLNDGGPVRQTVIDSSTAAKADGAPGVFARDDGHWQVVNVSPRESEMERCAAADFVDRFEIATGQPEETLPASLAPTKLELRENEVAHWVVFLLITLLAAEFFVANRTTA